MYSPTGCGRRCRRGCRFVAAERTLRGLPTEAVKTTEYTYTVTDSDAVGPDSVRLTFTITVDEDLVPIFAADVGVEDRVFTENSPVEAWTLPEATGGDGALAYALTPEPPPGLLFDVETRTLSGTPAEPMAARVYTYTVTDSDAREPDSASLRFRMAVEADLAPAFWDGQVIGDLRLERGEAMTPLELPAASGGDGVLTYALTPAPPAGLVFDPATRMLSGTPERISAAVRHEYSATDADVGSAPEVAALAFNIEVRASAADKAALNEAAAAQGRAMLNAATSVIGERFRAPVASGGGEGEGRAEAALNAFANLMASHAGSSGGYYGAGGFGAGGFGAGGMAGQGMFGGASGLGYGGAGFGLGGFGMAGVQWDFGPDSYGGGMAGPMGLGGMPGNGVRGYGAAGDDDVEDGEAADGDDSADGEDASDGETGVASTGMYNFGAMGNRGFGQHGGFGFGQHGGLGLGYDPRFGRGVLGRPGPMNGMGAAGQETDLAYLLSGRSFAMPLRAAGADDDDAAPPRWTLWGAADGQRFNSAAGTGRYNGGVVSLYLGADARFGRNGLAGAALSRSRGETDYSARGRSGRLEIDMTAVYPYLRRQSASGWELWAIGGAASGEATDTNGVANAVAESADVSMQMAAAGMRRPLRSLGRWELSLVGGIGFLSLGVDEDGHRAVDAIDATVSQGRLGVEIARSSLPMSPYVRVGARGDGGDGVTSNGVEVVGGIRHTGERLEVEGQLRWLGGFSPDDPEEYGGSARVVLKAREDGSGPRVTVSPTWGQSTSALLGGGSESLLGESSMNTMSLLRYGAPSALDSMTLESTLAYGFALDRGLLSLGTTHHTAPFANRTAFGLTWMSTTQPTDVDAILSRLQNLKLTLGYELATPTTKAGPFLILDYNARF